MPTRKLPAFPTPWTGEYATQGSCYTSGCGGISMRQYFAAMAMQGILSAGLNVYDVEDIKQISYKLADKMLED